MSRGAPFAYLCGDVTLSFDRSDPVRKAMYSFTTTDQKLVKVCVRYTTGSNGQQVCAETQTQTVDQKVTHAGTLRLHRADPSAPRP